MSQIDGPDAGIAVRSRLPHPLECPRWCRQSAELSGSGSRGASLKTSGCRRRQAGSPSAASSSASVAMELVGVGVGRLRSCADRTSLVAAGKVALVTVAPPVCDARLPEEVRRAHDPKPQRGGHARIARAPRGARVGPSACAPSVVVGEMQRAAAVRCFSTGTTGQRCMALKGAARPVVPEDQADARRSGQDRLIGGRGRPGEPRCAWPAWTRAERREREVRGARGRSRRAAGRWSRRKRGRRLQLSIRGRSFDKQRRRQRIWSCRDSFCGVAVPDGYGEWPVKGRASVLGMQSCALFS